MNKSLPHLSARGMWIEHALSAATFPLGGQGPLAVSGCLGPEGARAEYQPQAELPRWFQHRSQINRRGSYHYPGGWGGSAGAGLLGLPLCSVCLQSWRSNG